jgi:hypothetical protein
VVFIFNNNEFNSIKSMEGYVMSDFNWCHGPECHERHTQDRVRGVKGSKVLRTRKVKHYSNNHWYSWFCSQGCQNDFWKKHATEIVAIAPRTEALETPILNPEKKTHNHGYGNYNEWTITVDNTRANDIG